MSTIEIPDYDAIESMSPEQFRTFATMCCINFQQHQREQNGDIRRIKKTLYLILTGLSVVIATVVPESATGIIRIIAKALGV